MVLGPGWGPSDWRERGWGFEVRDRVEVDTREEDDRTRKAIELKAKIDDKAK